MPRSGRCSSSLAPLLRLVVDEPDEVDPVLGVLQDLAADQLPDISRADDDGVLDVGDSRAGKTSGEHAGKGDRRNADDPEQQVTRDLAVEVGQPQHREGGPRTDGDEVENADELVDGGVIGPLLVGVVEPVQLGQHHPERERGREDEQLDGRGHAARAVREHVLDDREGNQQAGDVGQQQHAADQPATPLDARGLPATLEDLERPGADGDGDLVVQCRRLQAQKLFAAAHSAFGGRAAVPPPWLLP